MGHTVSMVEPHLLYFLACDPGPLPHQSVHGEALDKGKAPLKMQRGSQTTPLGSRPQGLRLREGYGHWGGGGGHARKEPGSPRFWPVWWLAGSGDQAGPKLASVEWGVWCPPSPELSMGRKAQHSFGAPATCLSSPWMVLPSGGSGQGPVSLDLLFPHPPCPGPQGAPLPRTAGKEKAVLLSTWASKGKTIHSSFMRNSSSCDN